VRAASLPPTYTITRDVTFCCFQQVVYVLGEHHANGVDPSGLEIKYPQIESMSARPVRTGSAMRFPRG
jgi:hypothetical protein